MPVNTKELEKLYAKMKSKRMDIAQNERYVIGNNPAILDKQEGKAPDNRIPTPLAKSAVEDMTGYAGRAGDVKTSYEEVNVKEEVSTVVDPFIAYMDAMDTYNKVDLENSELYEESLNQGESYELWWTSDKKSLPGGLLTAEYKIVPNAEVLLVYSADLKRELLSAIHFTEQKESVTADIYYPEKKETWRKQKDKAVWIREAGETPYPYKIVPVNVFKSNRRSLPYFEAEKSLIDAHDEVLSKSMNEVDRFNAAILMNQKKIGHELAEGLKNGDVSILDDYSEAAAKFAEYLQKDFNGVNEFYTNLLDRFERLFHKSIKDPDMTSEAFASGDQSGIAIAFKLVGMEFKASQIETYFSQGLDRRLSFYADLWNASNNDKVKVEDYKAVIKTKRNIPVDVKAKAEVAQLLFGIVPRELLLEFLPKELVNDLDKALELMKKEVPSNTVSFDENE